ncbi:MAG: isoleucine--tRNA ligase [Planctomycetes bacterium]|nr:isoleucine--tRNA ligase [Planctomycetota bacterium]
MNYKDTINLPKTNFSMKADLVKKEPLIREKWVQSKLYEKIRELRKGKPKYILHDGPPYANGDVHVGTALNKILKDIVVKFKTMQGFDSPYVPGWDCHGLPIEHRVMTKLGEKAKTMPKADIRKECEKYARGFIDIQRKQFLTLGVLGEWDNPYLTLNPSYEAAIIEVFGDLVQKGFVYRKLKPIHWCMSCETALAEAELEYADEKSPSIYVKFLMNTEQLKSKIPECSLSTVPCSFFIWTTTPWTLPANVAVALNPAFEYAIVEYTDKKSDKAEILIFAESLVSKVMETIGIKDYKIKGKFKGSSFEGLTYQHPFIKRECRAILADYVTLEDGTGIVHIAPGHGQEDYESGLSYKLPVLSPVDKSGRLTEEAGIFPGEKVFDADPKICAMLEEKGNLLMKKDVVHSYPHCWRCKKPVIFRATEQWFISVDHNDTRQKALDQTRKVKWVPAWGETRISSMLEQRPDWCISRQRNWGVPIPVFYCAKCHEPLLDKKIIDIVRETFRKEGAMSWFVKQPVDFLPKETKCAKCGHTEFIKENDIFDVWFESGSSFRGAVIENKQLHFPADLYLEGTDQHRGWFQLSLLPSVMTRGVAPFKTVLTHGFVITPEGEKVSKSKGGLLLADEMVGKVGADIIRLWISSINFTEDIPVSMNILQEKGDPYRKIRNTFRYLLGNINDFNPKANMVKYESMTEIDKWALSKLHNLIKVITAAYDSFEFHKAYREIYEFCVVEMSSFYIDVLKDRLYTFAVDSVERRSAQTVMHEIATGLTKLVAPILAHTAEEIWTEINLDGKQESVHLADWPKANDKYINAELEANWAKLLKIKTEVSRKLDTLRKDGTLGSSLEAEVTLYTENAEWSKLLKQYEKSLPAILIISQAHLAEKKPENAGAGTDIPEIFIAAKKCSYQKCERCWNYREAVGKDNNYPTLCDRCIPVISGK